MKKMHRVTIVNRQRKEEVSLLLRALIKKAVRDTLAFENFEGTAEVSVTLTDNKNIHEMNLTYRNVDRPTDVLSFPTFDNIPDGEGYYPLGDIVLSLERAREQAEEYGHSFERETAFLCVHSVLHLLGYDHELSPEDEKEMFGRQEEILKKMGLTRE